MEASAHMPDCMQVRAQLTVSTFAHIKGQWLMDREVFTVALLASLSIACITAKSLVMRP